MIGLAWLLVGGQLNEVPYIAPFAHGKSSAFSMEFDDTMASQKKNLFPLLSKYKFAATLYINPGWDEYKVNQNFWEKEVPAMGHEIGNHTMHHRDTIGAEQAASEIGDAAKILHKALGKQSLMPFAIPGGVKWDIPKADFDRILKENNCFLPGREAFYQDGQGDITRFPKLALTTNSWHRIGFHGIGGQWLSTDPATVETLLKYLDAHRDKIWVAPTGVVWKYLREREALNSIEVLPDGGILPHFSKKKLEPFELYDVPLTMMVPVNSDWKKAKVTIDGITKTVDVKGHTVQFEFVPQAKSIVLLKG